MGISEVELTAFREQLKCNFKDLDEVFGDCMRGAIATLSAQGLKDYL